MPLWQAAIRLACLLRTAAIQDGRNSWRERFQLFFSRIPAACRNETMRRSTMPDPCPLSIKAKGRRSGRTNSMRYFAPLPDAFAQVECSSGLEFAERNFIVFNADLPCLAYFSATCSRPNAGRTDASTTTKHSIPVATQLPISARCRDIYIIGDSPQASSGFRNRLKLYRRLATIPHTRHGTPREFSKNAADGHLRSRGQSSALGAFSIQHVA